MIGADLMKAKWIETRDRLVAKGLLSAAEASLSVRCPGSSTMWLGAAGDAEPVLVDWRGTAAHPMAEVHTGIYACRADVGAIARSGGPFGNSLADFDGRLPQVFDEQARHIGPMAPAIEHDDELEAALRRGANALLWRRMPLCFGTTPTRLALNVELFEKCAKAYVLAAATGGRIRTLPWLVRRIANSRLAKDERRAAEAFARGELPAENRGY